MGLVWGSSRVWLLDGCQYYILLVLGKGGGGFGVS